MAAVRLMAKVKEGGLEAIRAVTLAARELPGCLHAEDFADIEQRGEILHSELWETPAAWDKAWPERQGVLSANLVDVEFYKHARFIPTGPSWDACDKDARAETIRWPISGAIRILIFVVGRAEDPNDANIQDSLETRAEPGCEEFTFFRSLDFPENLALIETWSTPKIYDEHWHRRIAQQSGPYPEPPPRRYGETSFEWYPQCRYALIDGIWQPASAANRMETVLW